MKKLILLLFIPLISFGQEITLNSVGYDSLDDCHSSWYNTWTFTIFGNSLTFESDELTFCDPDDFYTHTYN
ncbi:MAG: Uncharacterised protein [Flavobacterium sp. SCGC AAA160-P02]|nr:MAG: Uncharacterised protein [Flavobacterium sp. SCGC AAA160-P02]